jgi:hypothetical protein
MAGVISIGLMTASTSTQTSTIEHLLRADNNRIALEESDKADRLKVILMALLIGSAAMGGLKLLTRNMENKPKLRNTLGHLRRDEGRAEQFISEHRD